jgi:hypothetical protein
VKYKLRPDLRHDAGQTLEISNVAVGLASESVRFDYFMEIRISWRWETYAPDFRAKFFKPKRKPCAFEAGVACDQDTFAFVKGFIHRLELVIASHIIV